MKTRLAVVKERALKKEIEDYEDRRRELGRIRGIPAAPAPGVDGVPEVVNYVVRGPRDVVLSGPLTGRSKGPGREFETPEAAFNWAKDKYGEDRVTLIIPHEEVPRWAVLVKNLRA